MSRSKKTRIRSSTSVKANQPANANPHQTDVREGLRYHWPLLMVWCLTLLYLVPRCSSGWIAHDEGLLAQTAERVLKGELPHRDFDDPYSGALAMLHAAAFHFLGTNLLSMRMVLVGFCLTSVLAVYAILVRVTNPMVAAAGTIAAVVWSIPNYFASMPSWYNLFFAIFGTWSIIKYIETERGRWLLLAGVMGGLSILIKVTGLYFVAAGMLFVVFREQEMTKFDLSADCTVRRNRLGLPFSIVPLAAALIISSAVVLLIRGRFTAMDGLLFVIPTVLLSMTVLWNERPLVDIAWGQRLRPLATMVAIFSAGVALPIAIFAIPFIATSSVDSLMYGNFVLPQRRMQFASFMLPPVSSLVYVLPLALCLAPWPQRLRGLDRWSIVAILAVPSMIVAYLGGTPWGYQAFWNSLRPVVPLAVAMGCWTLLRAQPHDVSSAPTRQTLFLILIVTAMVSLVQYPFSAGIYFCYTAPLAIVSTIYGVRTKGSSPQRLQLCVLLAYTMFAVFWLNRNYIQAFGEKPLIVNASYDLELEKASLFVPAFDAQVYQGIVRRVQQESEPDDPILAMSDCPEVYFLCDRKNLTRTIYDFFDSDFEADQTVRTQRLIRMIDEHFIKVVVLRWKAEFSGPPDPELVRAIKARFKQVEDFWVFPDPNDNSHPDFSVFWRKR